MNNNNVILEIRPGVGGDEAELWARQLLDMYERLTNKLEWRWQPVSVRRSEIGGVKEAIIEIGLSDKGLATSNYQLVTNHQALSPYNVLRHEAGVHRVQRIPKTEKRGRIHTSTATAAVLPVVSEQEVNIKSNELQTEFYRASGHGGQNVNKVETAVRIRHIPTGFVVTSQEERSQAANRERAMEVLRAKLYAWQTQNSKLKTQNLRKEMIGTGDRSEKIRTYNFHQDRVTDHRIQKSWRGVERMLEGDVIKIINTLNAALNVSH